MNALGKGPSATIRGQVEVHGSNALPLWKARRAMEQHARDELARDMALVGYELVPETVSIQWHQPLDGIAVGRGVLVDAARAARAMRRPAALLTPRNAVPWTPPAPAK